MITLVNNIIKTYNEATPEEKTAGLTWYNTAYAYCKAISDATKIDLDKVIQLCALFSPQASWERNMASLKEYTYTGRSRYLSGYQHVAAKRILDGQHLKDFCGGRKVVRFYHSIATQGLGDCVCVDTHAINLARGEIRPVEYRSSVWSSDARYNVYEQSYIRAAKKLKVPVQQIQAITWVAWRNKNGRKN